MSDETFSALESYVQAMHEGRPPNRGEILRAHPELAGMLDCLEDLQRLTASVSAAADTAAFVPIKTGLTTPPDEGHRGEAVQRPTDFDQYELLEELGRGGMGVVYKARQKDLDRLVAIKMILSGKLSSAEQLQRFAAEARLAAQLQHPNIVHVFATGERHGHHYFVMEYVAGPSLAQALRQGPVAPDEAARITSTIARAVEHLHAHQIVHRDLKPANILLVSSGECGVGSRPGSKTSSASTPLTPKITDFGLAKLLEGDSHQTTTGAIVGTPSYMSPEQAAGQRELVGPKSDVYSLGAILYELLTGRPPFRAETALDTIVQVLESEPARPRQLNPHVPRSLERICLKCLEKSPEERYSSAAALADDLERYLAHEPVEAQRPTPWQRLRRWAAREPALASRLGALGFFLVIEHIQYLLTHETALSRHLTVLEGFGMWALASWLFQLCLRHEWRAEAARYLWSATDVALLSWLLLFTSTQGSPLVVGYPVLIACSGLWFRIPLVWFTTAAAFVAYLVLAFNPDPQLVVWRTHQHLLFLVALVVVGFAVAYQVRRVRALSRFYQQRSLP